MNSFSPAADKTQLRSNRPPVYQQYKRLGLNYTVQQCFCHFNAHSANNENARYFNPSHPKHSSKHLLHRQLALGMPLLESLDNTAPSSTSSVYWLHCSYTGPHLYSERSDLTTLQSQAHPPTGHESTMSLLHSPQQPPPTETSLMLASTRQCRGPSPPGHYDQPRTALYVHYREAGSHLAKHPTSAYGYTITNRPASFKRTHASQTPCTMHSTETECIAHVLPPRRYHIQLIKQDLAQITSMSPHGA